MEPQLPAPSDGSDPVFRAPPGWHGDPFGRFDRRYWDGNQWTRHVMCGERHVFDQNANPPAAPVAPVAQPSAGWYPDPASNGDHRYWDGRGWTNHVQTVGPSTTRVSAPHPTPPPVVRTNKKVVRQATEAGADPRQSGGGTLLTEHALIINQKAKVLGSTSGYAIFSSSGVQLGIIEEVRRGWGTKVGDSLIGRQESRRSHRFRVADMNGRILLEMTRPSISSFTTKGKLIVHGPGGAPLGQIVHGPSLGRPRSTTSAESRRMQDRVSSAVKGLGSLGKSRFRLEAGGQLLGTIYATGLDAWDFKVDDPTGTEVAAITKTWAGWAKERFTNADNYVVQMHQQLHEPLRSLIIASALAIDVALKQSGDQTRRRSGFTSRSYK